MTSLFKTLLLNNQPLDVENKILLAEEWDETLELDDLFSREQVRPVDIADMLRKYGWFWVSIERDAKNNDQVTDIVVVDLHNETDTAKSEIQYYDTRSGEMQTGNFTDFVQRVKQGNQAEALKTAIMRLNKNRFEGSSGLRFPGFPAKSYKRDAFPPNEKFIRLYQDFLYYSDKKSFAAYLYSYLVGIAGMTTEEKAIFFEEMIYFKFNTMQASLRIQENCVMSTKVTLFKLMGLLPHGFEVLAFKEDPRLPVGSPRTTWITDYPEDLHKWLKEELDLNIYEFTTIMGLTGALDMESAAYKKMGLQENTAAGRREVVISYLNNKIIPFLLKHTPHASATMQVNPYLIRENKKEEIHEFIVKLGDPATLFPAGIQVIHSSGLPHFIAVVHNPFKNTLIVLDPLITGEVENDVLVKEYISNITITDENGLYGWIWPEGRYKTIYSRRCFLTK